MKRLLMICFLVLIAVIQTNTIHAFSEQKTKEDCFPVTYFDTFDEAVVQYKKLTDSISPILKPTWLPFEATLKTVRIVGCGSILKMEYARDNQVIKLHINPLVKDSKLNESTIISLRDGKQAEYKENNLLHILRFEKVGRSYMIIIEKNNVKQVEKETLITYLTKVADSLVEVNSNSTYSR